MKELRKLTLLSVAVSSVMALSACSNGSSVGGNNSNSLSSPQKVEIDLADKVQILDKTVNNDVTKITVNDDNLLVLDVSNPNSALTSKKIGDIVYLPPKTANDLGVFVKIKEIKTNSNGSTQVITEQPDGAEVFDSIDANVTGVKPKILGIIAPNSDLSKVKGLSQHSGLQQGLIGLEEKVTVPISFAIKKPKAKYSTAGYDKYPNYCSYPKYMAEDYQISYAEALNRADEICDDVLKLDGSVELNIGEVINTLDIKKGFSGGLTARRANGKLSLKDTELSAKLNIQLLSKEVRVSEIPLFAKFYAEQYFADYQRKSADGFFAKVAINGLSSDDKKGKIPLAGFVFGVGGVIGFTHGNTGIATDLASPLGGVAMAYLVLDATGKISVEVEYVYNSGKKEIGIEQKDNQISALLSNTAVDSDSSNEVTLKGEISGEIQAGLAVEGDFFLGGIRFANVGGQYVYRPNGSLAGEAKYNISTGEASGSGCRVWGIGEGFIVYGNMALGLEGSLGIGFFKAHGKGNIQYGFMYPEQDKLTDPTFISPVWKYKESQRLCITDIPASFTTRAKIMPPSLNAVGAVTATQGAVVDINVDVPLKDESDNFRTTIKKWTLAIAEANSKVNDNKLVWQKPIEVIVTKDGKLSKSGIINQFTPIIVPYGDSIIKLTAIDYMGREVSRQMKVHAESPIKTTILTMTPVPNDLVVGQDFELTITGVALGSNTMFKVDGCHNQRKVSMNTVLHIYKCTAPTMATKNHKLVVFGADGKQQYYTTKLEIHQSIPISVNLLEFLSEPRYYLESDNSRYGKFIFTKGAYNNGMTNYVLNDVEYKKDGNKWKKDDEERESLKVKGNDIFVEENNTLVGKAVVSKINDLSTQGYPKGAKSYNIVLTNLQDEYDIYSHSDNYLYQNIGSLDSLLNNYQTMNQPSGNTLWLDNLVNGYEAVFTFDKSSNQTNGTVQIYQANYKNGNFQQTKLGTGTWQRVKINGNDMIKVQPSKALYSKFDDLNQDGVARIYVKRSNERGVREGEFRAKGVQENDIFYNKIAINHLMNKNKLPAVVD